MRGRRPKPTALKIATGNPGKRKLNEHEPAPAAYRGKCPSFVKGDARKRWNQIVPPLIAIGVFTEIDVAAMVRLCEAWALWRKALAEVEKRGEVITTYKGNLIQSPWLGIANKQNEIMRKLETEFGLTPSSRSRLTAGDAKPADELNDFIDAGPDLKIAQ